MKIILHINSEYFLNKIDYIFNLPYLHFCHNIAIQNNGIKYYRWYFYIFVLQRKDFVVTAGDALYDTKLFQHKAGNLHAKAKK